MQIIELGNRNPSLIADLTDLWEKSVRATHLFLPKSEIENIKKCIPQALQDVAHLVVAMDESEKIIAFMGVENRRIEMLFISPEHRRKGLGRKLIQFGIENFSIDEVAVNEQNVSATKFYEHMGFETYKRTETDEQGRPYPLLYMKLKPIKIINKILRRKSSDLFG